MHKLHGNSEMSPSFFKHLNQYFFVPSCHLVLFAVKRTLLESTEKKYFNSLKNFTFYDFKRLAFAFQESARIILLMFLNSQSLFDINQEYKAAN